VFGEVVREHRRRLGLTQEDLAARTGISARQIRDIEAGRVGQPRSGTVRLFADAFNLRGPDRERFREAVLESGQETPMPAQLPPDIAGFVGRAGELDRLDTLLRNGASGTPVVIAAISGAAGIGKTTLAVNWAHRVAHRFPDGQLYVNLRGFDPTGTAMVPAEALRGFLQALGVAPQQLPAGQDAQVGLYRSLLAGRRVLVVLDNARDDEQVRPLLPGAPGCLVLVTSRDQLPGLVAGVGAQPIGLDLPSECEAVDMLAYRLGAARLHAEPAATQEIVTRCARLPLALAVVAARAASRPSFPLAVYADQLRSTRGGLDAFDSGDPATDVRTAFSWSYHTLGGAAARLFRLLGIHPGPDITPAAAASLAGEAPSTVRTMLAELARAHLVTEHAPDRYSLHDLLRSYGSELVSAEVPDDERRTATRRVLDHYLHTAYPAALLLRPNRDTIAMDPPQPGVTPEELTGADDAVAWFTAERPVLLAAIRLATDAGLDAHAWRLAWAMVDYLERQGYWHDWAALLTDALDAVERLDDLPGQAHCHRHLGRAYLRLGRYGEANRHLARAADLHESIGDRTGVAHAEDDLAVLFGIQRDFARARRHAAKALDRYREIGDVAGQAKALNNIGLAHAMLGEYDEALRRCQQALVLLRTLGDRAVAAATWDSVGYAQHHLGRYPEAIAAYRQAVDLFHDGADRYSAADTLGRLGDTYAAAGDRTAARETWREAAEILAELGHPDAEAIDRKLRTLEASDI
jgi:tetratricopeptide (TPR) repeat protein/transcriptional regulator with XRE-family HTH domain